MGVGSALSQTLLWSTSGSTIGRGEGEDRLSGLKRWYTSKRLQDDIFYTDWDTA